MSLEPESCLNPTPRASSFAPLVLRGDERPLRILARVLALPESEVVEMLGQVLSEFKARHQKLLDYFLVRFEFVRGLLPTNQPLSQDRKLLIGAYFTHEYSLEAAALFNPSMVPHPDQTGLPPERCDLF